MLGILYSVSPNNDWLKKGFFCRLSYFFGTYFLNMYIFPQNMQFTLGELLNKKTMKKFSNNYQCQCAHGYFFVLLVKRKSILYTCI